MKENGNLDNAKGCLGHIRHIFSDIMSRKALSDTMKIHHHRDSFICLTKNERFN